MEKHTDEKMLLARAEDAVFLAEKQQTVKAVGFLTPSEAALIGRKLPKTETKTEFFGGYAEAERTLFAALPVYAEESELFSLITALEITGRGISALSHRDYLGSLLGLGIKREKIGDIVLLENSCIVFVQTDIADFITENLTKVGSLGVSVKKTECENVQIPKRKTEKITASVASLRIDCVLAAMLKTSRSKAIPYITGAKVSVNWEEKTQTSVSVKEGDVFSVRGVGRFVLSKVNGETKKGRISVEIDKMV